MYLIDYHVHLEEGPYDFAWLIKVSQALEVGQGSGRKEELLSQLNELMTHITTGSFTESYLDLYLATAIEKGIKEVGIVDHLYRFYESASYYEKGICLDESKMGILQRKWLNSVMVTKMDEFVSFIQSQKLKWERHGVTLRLGIEVDYFKGLEAEARLLIESQPWDFVIGAVHFIEGWGFDNAELKEYYEKIDLMTWYIKHFDLVGCAIKSQLFNMVAHLDNLKVFGYRPSEGQLMPYYEEVAQLLVDYDVATEVNSGLLYRYPIAEACPSPTFLEILVNKGVEFTVSSDSHFPYHLGMKVEDSLSCLRKLGIKSVVTFKNRNKEEVLFNK